MGEFTKWDMVDMLIFVLNKLQEELSEVVDRLDALVGKIEVLDSRERGEKRL